jgi:hypothetical protein
MGEFKSPSEKQSAKATPAKKSQENSSVAEADFLDSRSSTFQLKKFQEAAQDSGRGSGISQLQTKSSIHTGTSRVAQLQGLSDTRIASEQSALIQKKENKTGIPDGLKAGMESVSGMSLNDVTVHRNSDKPAQLQAHAYAQGTDVHLAPGQEKHLPHELGHVVQQKQGRVAPTVQLKGEVPVNDSPSLEKEADSLGAKAKSLGMTSEAGVTQLKGMEEEEVLQGKFSKDNVAQLEGDETGEKVDKAMTVVGAADKVNSAVQAGFGEEGKIATDAINGDASGIAGTVFSSLQSLVDLVKSGADLWENKNWESGADFFLQVADTASSIMDTLNEYKVMGEVPVLGPAIAAFKAGMGIFKSNRSLTLLREFEDGKKAKLTEDEKLTLQRYVSSLKVEIGSNSIDFALSIGKAVGDFFPPAGTAISIVSGAKSAFMAGYTAWTSYKSSKEKQALSRISGGSEAELGEAELEQAGALSAKVAKAEPDSLKSSNGTLMDMVNMKFEIEDVKSQIASATDEAAKTELKTKEGNLTTKLNESIAIYNTTMGNIDPSAKITYSDVENLQAIHAKVIMTYLNKKEEEKSWWESAKSALGGPLAPMKDKILAELGKTAPQVTDKDIQEISKGQHAAALWKKTQEALNEASKGRSHFTRAELNTKMTKILKDYQVPADQIKMIVRA